jgi:hypothetical protein
MFFPTQTPEASNLHAKTRSDIVSHRLNNYYIYYIYVVAPPEAGLWGIPDCNNIDKKDIFSVEIKEVENRPVVGAWSIVFGGCRVGPRKEILTGTLRDIVGLLE